MHISDPGKFMRNCFTGFIPVRKGLSKYFLLIFLLCSTGIVRSQSLIFCEKVTEDGTARSPSTHFAVGKNGGFLRALVRLNKGVQSEYAVLDIYKWDEKSKSETYESTVRVNTQPEWTWFSKELVFSRPGNYNVYVYDDKDQLLCVGRIKIDTP